MELDHIAVAGESLEAASAHVEEALGVALQPGGAHDVFFTHNRLLGLEDGLYLEAIAIDPDAPAPSRPRWFDLDRFFGAPRLTNWICRTPDLNAVVKDLPGDVGAPVQLARGALRWQMAVPQSGALPFDNLHPALIEWGTPQHPAQMLAQVGVRLTRLVVAHPDAVALRAQLAAQFSDARVVFEVGEPALVAEFATPHGRRSLR